MTRIGTKSALKIYIDILGEEKVLKPNSSSTEVSHKALDLDTSE